MFERSSGILLPIFSLPSKYGIGTFGKEAYKFVDFLSLAGQSYWQILPLGPTSYGNSPYSTFSDFAGNPYFIDLDILVEEGFLQKGDLEKTPNSEEYIDYGALFHNRFDILRKAYTNKARTIDLSSFIIQNPWVLDYALFMSLKYKNNQLPWYKWDKELANRDRVTLEKLKGDLNYEIGFWIFIQDLFFKQYYKLKDYANKKGISIIGDIPIYVAGDSVDAWTEESLFIFDEDKLPIYVAGVPPDDFSDEGQLWGNPVYDWEYLKESHFEWWINRITYSLKLYDYVRLDHFRGFDEFWAVLYGSKNAVNGKWMPAYGRDLFKKLREDLAYINIIAEDLGTITDSVKELKKDTNFPGMTVFQFGFDGNPDNPHLPDNYEENSVAYTGTHDNDTLKGWLEKLSIRERQNLLDYLNRACGKKIEENNIDSIIYAIISLLYKSKAGLSIVPLQDFLFLGSEGRINRPSTLENNWIWRLKKSQITEELVQRIRLITLEGRRG